MQREASANTEGGLTIRSQNVTQKTRKSDRVGQYSIRINDQWRICFKWSGNKAKDVEIVDYHR